MEQLKKIDLYSNTKPYIKCIDYTVSNETYTLYKNEEFDLLVTKPVPDNLDDYYKSDDYISHTDSKKSLFDFTYQIVKNYTLKQKLKLINSFNTEEKTILDIGAGTGDFLSVCKKNNWEINGVEPSENARELASKKNIILENSVKEFQNKTFDVITLWHVLEHIPTLPEFIQTLKKLLKPNGILIIAVPNYKSYDAQIYKEFWAGYDVPRHLWHFSQTSIKKLFSLVNMNVIKILPMKFDAFYVSLLSEKYKKNKLGFIKAFFNGLRSNIKAKKSSEYSSLIYILKN